MAEFLKWMQGGLASAGAVLLAKLTSGEPWSLGSLGLWAATTVLVRAAGWIISKWGPAPAA